MGCSFEVGLVWRSRQTAVTMWLRSGLNTGTSPRSESGARLGGHPLKRSSKHDIVSGQQHCHGSSTLTAQRELDHVSLPHLSVRLGHPRTLLVTFVTTGQRNWERSNSRIHLRKW
jgi:hypothetical protein